MPFVIGRFTHNFFFIYIYLWSYSSWSIHIKNIYIRAGNETFEKLGTVGSSTNLAVYLTTVFNMKSVKATTLLNVFNGTSNLAPLIGAYLSDTYFGRYWTLGFASVFSFLVILCLLTHLLQLFERFFFSLRCSIMK
jgi:dipeptide/tripeptide permease